MLVALPEDHVQSGLSAVAQEVIELHYSGSRSGHGAPQNRAAPGVDHPRRISEAIAVTPDRRESTRFRRRLPARLEMSTIRIKCG